MIPSLGTEVRRLIELLDGDLELHYRRLGLDYRPRFTPIVRALEVLGPTSIKSISDYCALTHSAVSQTVSHMVKCELLVLEAGRDGRERIVTASAKLQQMIPALHYQWAATNRAAQKLSDELDAPILEVIMQAIVALKRLPFAKRIETELESPHPR